MADLTLQGLSARVAALEAALSTLTSQVERNTARLDALPPDVGPFPVSKDQVK